MGVVGQASPCPAAVHLVRWFSNIEMRVGGWRGGLALGLLLVLLLTLCLHSSPAPPNDHWMGFTDREARLASRLREAESQARWLRLQLTLSQDRVGRALSRRPPPPGCPLAAEACETIHVAIVCAGSNASRTVVTLVKSILFYRRNPIHFHFLSDLTARTILTRLAATWKLPQVTFRFYSVEDVVEDISWIPNKHYSGVFGLLKLTLPKVLPHDLDRVIVLDTDVTFATDIGRLWAVFQRFGAGQALGLVENQSDWYIPGKLWKNHRPWPALGRGFNTGVILMELAVLRAADWSQVWRLVAETDLVTMLSTSLADQDVFNAVVHRHPALLHRLPCQWNVQLSDNSLSDELCYAKLTADTVNVIHFNSPKKIYSENKHVSFFRNIHLTFVQFDGNLLRKELYNCQEESLEGNNQKEVGDVIDTTPNPCGTFWEAGKTVFRTHLYFLPHCPSNATGETTLVTQLSMDRLHMLVPLLERWSGPASIAVYLTDTEAQDFVDHWERSTSLTSRCNVGYHVAYKEGNLYPINALRNLALEQAATDYVFLTDIDFLPSTYAVSSLAASTRSLLLSHPLRSYSQLSVYLRP